VELQLAAAADQLRSELVSWLNSNKETLATGALSITSSVGTLATSGLTMLFCLFFFLKEGRSIWLWCVRLLPAPARVPVHESAIRGWATCKKSSVPRWKETPCLPRTMPTTAS